MTLDEFKYRYTKLTSSTHTIKDILGLCNEFLVANGYRVHEPIVIEEDFKLSKYADLVKLFYTYHFLLYDTELPKSQNEVADNRIASNFVKARQQAGGGQASKKRALEECALIIKTVLLNKELFSFDKPLGFWVFGTDTCRWITDKAIDIIEKERKIISDGEMLLRIDSMSYKLSDSDKHIDIEGQLELVKDREVKNG